MKRLGFLDDAFLRLESRRQPLHIGILMLFQPPADAGEDFTVRLADRLRKSTTAAAPFNWRLVTRKGLHYWEEDDEFDLAHHFAHTALPSPGRVRELLALVSRVHSGHLDRAYPLWRMYLIEGLEDGRIAVYLKIHHSLVDGVAGMRMLLKCMSTDAESSLELPPLWEVQTLKSPSQPLPVPTPAAGSLPALRSLAREGFRSVAPLLRELRSTFDDLRADNPDLTLAGTAPKCLFNVPVSATRRFAAQSYSTPRIRAVAEAYDATVNDVILAMCSGALRRYLDGLGAAPERSLTAAVPVSVRRHGSDGANEVAFTMTSLATDLDDPAQRLRAIKQGMDYNKARINRLSSAQLQAYTAVMMLPGQLGSVVGNSGERALANVVISHVPGPRRAMYWQGARLTGLYPVSLIIDGGALNITLVSRHDYVDIGLIACRKSVPHMQRLLEFLEDALADLEATVTPAGKPRKADGGSRYRKKPVADAEPRGRGNKSAATARGGAAGSKPGASKGKPRAAGTSGRAAPRKGGRA